VMASWTVWSKTMAQLTHWWCRQLGHKWVEGGAPIGGLVRYRCDRCGDLYATRLSPPNRRSGLRR